MPEQETLQEEQDDDLISDEEIEIDFDFDALSSELDDLLFEQDLVEETPKKEPNTVEEKEQSILEDSPESKKKQLNPIPLEEQKENDVIENKSHEKSTIQVQWDDNALNTYLYVSEPEQENDFFDVGRDNFFSTLAYAMEGGGDFFEQSEHIVIENDPYSFYNPMFEP